MIKIASAADAAEQLRQAYGCFPSGVTAVCALVDGIPVGMAASSFTSVSMNPPLVSVCIQHSSTTWPKIQPRSRLGVSVLAEGQDAECLALSSKGQDRFAGIAWTPSPDGAVYVSGATAWLECSLEAELPAGDHLIALLRIHGLRAEPARSPLVFHGSVFRSLAAVSGAPNGAAG
ncbi:flavin reductase family protein [Cryptosporangium sp. NPDC051539]|uniref:flavin reductase family protein n=1 Tax=Cryptosporangium sp. NPDC051539 TaxID=3363962 RepID=UPI0037B23368